MKVFAKIPERELLFSRNQLFHLLWPLVIEQLLSVLVGMVDVLMVAYVGEATVSGVSLVDSVNWLVFCKLAGDPGSVRADCGRYRGLRPVYRQQGLWICQP